MEGRVLRVDRGPGAGGEHDALLVQPRARHGLGQARERVHVRLEEPETAIQDDSAGRRGANLVVRQMPPRVRVPPWKEAAAGRIRVHHPAWAPPFRCAGGRRQRHGPADNRVRSVPVVLPDEVVVVDGHEDLGAFLGSFEVADVPSLIRVVGDERVQFREAPHVRLLRRNVHVFRMKAVSGQRLCEGERSRFRRRMASRFVATAVRGSRSQSGAPTIAASGTRTSHVETRLRTRGSSRTSPSVNSKNGWSARWRRVCVPK